MGSFNKAFTLMELMVVVTIVGIVAAFAVPDYKKSVERAHRKNAENNLRMIHAAQQLYRAHHDTYFCCGNLSAINTNLGLNIIANGMTYSLAQPGGAGTYTGLAVRNGGWAFTVSVTQAQPVNPACTGICP